MKRAVRGFGILWAILVLVVLAVLAAGALRLTATQQTTYANDAVGAQLYFAAVSAVEWGVQQAVTGATPPDPSVCTREWLFAGSGVVGAPIWVTVTCTRTPNPTDYFCDGGNAIVTYRITATACSPVSLAGGCPRNDAAATQLGYAERVVSASARWMRAEPSCLR